MVTNLKVVDVLPEENLILIGGRYRTTGVPSSKSEARNPKS